MSEAKLLTRSQVAALLAVSPATVSRWARQGYLAWVATAGGHRRYSRETVHRLRESLFGEQRSQAPVVRKLEQLVRQGDSYAPNGANIVEIRCHGRAGQGLITAGELLAEAALRDGKYFQAFPEFGAERAGAPMEAFIRISPAPIDAHVSVLHPQAVLVFDSTLLTTIPVFRGVREGGLAAVNSPASPEALRRTAGMPASLDLVTVDATRLAQEHLQRPIPNIPMLGALLRALPVVSPELMAEVIAVQLRGRLSPPMVAANQAAFWGGYREARISKGPASTREVRP